MKYILCCFLVCASDGFAEIRPQRADYSIKAFLVFRKSEANISVNPMTRGRYFLKVQNLAAVAKALGTKEYIGQVNVTFKVMDSRGDTSSVIVKKISPIQVEKLPEYDGAFVPVSKN